MEKIICENFDGISYNTECFLSGDKFAVKGPVKYSIMGHDIAPWKASAEGFELAADFKIGFSVNTKQKLATYLQELGFERNSQGYMKSYAKFSEALPSESLSEGLKGKHGTGNIGFLDLKTG